MSALTERFEMRFDEETIARIDHWRDRAGASRAEAVRQLVDTGLAVGSGETVSFSDGEKLLLLMMRDVFAHLGIEEPHTDAEFISKVIYGGHYWAPKLRMSGVFHGYRDSVENLRLVMDVLDVWWLVEVAFERLTEKEQKQVVEETDLRGGDVRFPGFGGNDEAELLGIADFLIEEVGRFTVFKERDLNANFPMTAAYRRMLRAFEPMKRTLTGRDLAAGEVIQLLSAWRPKA